MAYNKEREMAFFKPPKECPACNSLLVWKKNLLYCENSSCPAKQAKQVEHFAKTLKIKGLGPATIKKLELSTIQDIYLSELSPLSEKMVDKLREEIGLSLKSPLNAVLPAFGIPLVGQSVTNSLSTVCTTIFDINEETCKQAGLGQKTTSNLLNWLALNLADYLEIPFDFTFHKKEESDSKGIVCISGKLKSYKTKAEAAKKLEAAGYKVASSLTKDVTHLVNESGVETAKTQKAALNNVTIINNLNDLIGEY